MDLDAALNRLAADPSAPTDVAQLAIYLARDEYPDLDVDGYLVAIDELGCQGRPLIEPHVGNLEQQVAGLSQHLFDELRYRGNVQDYYDPDNSYLPRVIERRLGLPITLSVLTMGVAAHAGMTVHGVGLPGHFVVKAVDGDQEVIFDPFHGGQVLSACDCELLVQQVTGQPFTASPEVLQPIPPGLLVRRMLTNLKGVYMRRRDFARAARTIGRIRQLVPDDCVERRDLGVCLLHAGQPGRAIDLLSEYLEVTPDRPDAAKVENLLKQAKGEVARWN